MDRHPIEGLMITAMQSIKEMVDVNTIVGDAVQSPDGTVIIPISKVSFGFAAGGGEHNISHECSDADSQEGKNSGPFPFWGGSGAGVSIDPVAFMVVGQGQIRLIPVNINPSVDRMIDLIPRFVDELIPDALGKMCDSVKRKVKFRGNSDRKVCPPKNILKDETEEHDED